MVAMPDRDVYVKGSLSHLPLPKTLNYIHQAKKTGILAIVRGPKKVHIHFDGGQIVHVTSSYFPGLSLGEYLVKNGKITQEIATESFEKTRSGDAKQGMYLVEHQLLSPHELFEALNTHVTLKLYTLFEWPEGDFFFKQTEIIEPEHRILKIHMGNLILIGIRDYFPMTTLPMEFKGRKENLIFRRPDCKYREDDIAFGPMGTRVFSLVNGTRTLRQVVALTKFKKSIAYKLLYAMFLLGFIGFPEMILQKEPKRTSYQERVLKEHETKVSRKKNEGYEIALPEDLITEAVKSVERIHQTVGTIDATGEEAEIRVPSGPAGEAPRRSSAQTRMEEATIPPKAEEKPFPEEDDFSLKIEGESGREEALFEEEHAEAKEGSADEFSWEGSGKEQQGPGLGEEESLDAYTTGYQGDDLGEYKTPEELLKQATHLITDNHFAEAERYLNRALELDGNYAEAYPYLGWCMYNRSAGAEYRKAEQLIKSGIKLNPGMFQSFLYLGKIYKMENQSDFAELHFVKAIELNVDCTEAKEEIKKIRQR